MRGLPKEGVTGNTQRFPGAEPVARTASGSTEDSEFGLMKANKEAGQEECETISIYST